AGRRRVQVGPREPLRIERRVELSRLFGRKIGNDDPGDAGLRRIARERGEAARIAKERIRVTHEEHRGVSLPRESTGLGDASGKSGPAPQRDLARALHRRAIRERVAERDAELEHVRTAIERLAVGARDIPYATAACERRVLRSDAWIVEPRRDRVGLADLAVLVLKDERARAVEHAHLSADDRRGVMPGLDALATRLDADELHRRVVDERAEDPDGIGSTADARDDDVWRPANRRSRLVLGLASDDRLEVADHRRIWIRSDCRREQVRGAPVV